MILEKQFNSLSEFEQYLETLRPNTAGAKPGGFSQFGTMLFRGQSDANWGLTTSLERVCDAEYECEAYQQLMKSIKDEVEVFTDNKWDWVDQSSIPVDFPEEVLAAYPTLRTFPARRFANFNLMAYLRHYGFPSPLLDWTRSHYIAAFFGASAHSPMPWALYIYDEFRGYGKVGSANGSQPEITVVSQRDTFQRRHFLQQSEYTVCSAFNKRWRFVSHEHVLKRPGEKQDLLTKCIFPASTRTETLRKLEKMNINAFSLFSTQEALLQVMQYRRFPIPEAAISGTIAVPATS